MIKLAKTQWLSLKNKNYYVKRRMPRSRYTQKLSLIFLINEWMNQSMNFWIYQKEMTSGNYLVLGQLLQLDVSYQVLFNSHISLIKFSLWNTSWR